MGSGLHTVYLRLPGTGGHVMARRTTSLQLGPLAFDRLAAGPLKHGESERANITLAVADLVCLSVRSRGGCSGIPEKMR